MSFQWNVQPYAWKKDLINEYASGVLMASRKRAVQYGAEAEAWMKQNAPWTDRTEAERAEQVRLGRLAASGVPARQALKVDVDMSEEQQYNEERAALTESILNQHEADYKRAVQQAEQKYRQDSVVPYETALERLLDKVDAGSMTIEDARYLAESRSDPKQIIVPQSVAKSVPKGKPNFQSRKDFDKEYRSRRMPIVTLRFHYGKNTPYAVWLEISKGGRYAILGPALEKYAEKFFADVHRIANLKQFRDRIIFGETTTPEQRFQEYVAAGGKVWERSARDTRAKRRPEYDIAFERAAEEGFQFTPIGHHKARRAASRRKGR